MVAMAASSVRGYLKFLISQRSTYVQFNKQLLLGELAGFGAGIAAAEAAAVGGYGNLEISAYSSIADYGGSTAGFLAVYYSDHKSLHLQEKGYRKLKSLVVNAMRLWPSVVTADIAYIIARPYIHYVSMSSGLEAGIAATIAHFLAFGVFNVAALVSRSVIDYVKHVRMDPA